MTGKTADILPYRPCVGIMLLNQEGRAWIGHRLPKWIGDGSEYMWQMPQGGIDEGERPLDAALRELKEETGTDKVEVLGESRNWLCYDLPKDLVSTRFKGQYRGQRQKWFAMRFLGRECDIDISEHPGHKAEFDAWRWVELSELVELVVPFKRAVYEVLVEEFAPLAGR